MTNLMSLITAFLISSTAAASSTPQQNQSLLDRLQAARIGTQWSCAKSENAEAVVIFKVTGAASGLLSGDEILAIQDPQICASLQVTCPFVASVNPGTFVSVGPAEYSYWATRGKYEDTVMFFSAGSGMKLVRVLNGSQPSASWEQNWYFNEGECALQK